MVWRKQSLKNLSVHVCLAKVFRRSPTSSGIHLLVPLRVSRVATPRVHALEYFCFNFGKWMGIQRNTYNIYGIRGVQNRTHWHFRHHSLHTCDVSDHVTKIETFHWKWRGTSFLGRKTFEISRIEQNSWSGRIQETNTMQCPKHVIRQSPFRTESGLNRQTSPHLVLWVDVSVGSYQLSHNFHMAIGRCSVKGRPSVLRGS